MENIKKFFKWIADYTGISWIVKKASSGWKWLFSSKANAAQENTSPKRHSDENVNKSNTVPTVSTPMQNETEESVSKTDINVEPTENFPEKSEQPRRHVNPNKPKEVGELKCVGKELLFVPTSNQFAKCKDYRNTQSANPDELFMFIKCGANEYRIIGDSTKESISIKSILRKNKNGDYIDGNILRVEEEIRSVKKMLGLKDDVTEIKVDSIYNEPFGVKIPTTTAQQTVNNKEVTTESEKFYDAAEELDDDFHDAPEDFCNQPRSITGEPEAQIHYISNPSKVGNGYC